MTRRVSGVGIVGVLAALPLVADGSARADDGATQAAQSQVRVHLIDKGARLESSEEPLDTLPTAGAGVEDVHWDAACEAPCGVWMNRLRTYRLRMPGSRPTPAFRLLWDGKTPEQAFVPLEVEVRHRPERLRMYRAGVVLTVLGPMLTVFMGIIPVVAGAGSSNTTTIAVGGVGLGIGVAATVMGSVFVPVGKNRVAVTPRVGTVGAPP